MQHDSSTRLVGPRPDTPTGLWRLLRGSIVIAAGWLVLAAVAMTSTAFALLTLRIGATGYMYRFARFVGWALLGLQGIELRVIHGERVADRQARIITINHSSQLDMFVFASVMPPHGTALGKKEFLLIPFIGWFFLVFGVLTIDRKHPKKARQSIAKTAEIIRKRRASVIISPEGTRSKDGRLQPFKMGVFHLAKDVGVPIVPAVVRGVAECLPMGKLIARPGVVEVEFLEPIDTSAYKADNLAQQRDALQALYARALGSPPPVVQPAAAH